jgi:hypothetical protein
VKTTFVIPGAMPRYDKGENSPWSTSNAFRSEALRAVPRNSGFCQISDAKLHIAILLLRYQIATHVI